MSGLDPDFRRRLEEDLFNEIADLIERATLAGVVLGSGSGAVWDLANDDAIAWARSYSFELVKGITDTTMTFLEDAVAEWIDSGEALDELIAKIDAGTQFGSVRAKMIAETEVTRAFAMGNLIAWSHDPSVVDKTWHTTNDELVCPICGGLNDQTVSLDQNFYYEAEGIEVAAPPAHVRCRCWVRPNTVFEVVKPKEGEPGFLVFTRAGLHEDDYLEAAA